MPAVHVNLRERSLLERILYGILVLAVLMLGFFFLAAALIAGSIIAAIVLARVWWLKRKLRRSTAATVIATEYSVVEREQPPAPQLPPPQ